MEITKLQIKTKTLSKPIFNQLETTKEWTDDQVLGWTMINGLVSLLIRVVRGNDVQLMVVPNGAFFNGMWRRTDLKVVGDQLQAHIKKYYHHFDQIILS